MAALLESSGEQPICGSFMRKISLLTTQRRCGGGNVHSTRVWTKYSGLVTRRSLSGYGATIFAIAKPFSRNVTSAYCRFI